MDGESMGVTSERTISGSLILEDGSGIFEIDGTPQYLRLTSNFFDYNKIGTGFLNFRMVEND